LLKPKERITLNYCIETSYQKMRKANANVKTEKNASVKRDEIR